MAYPGWSFATPVVRTEAGKCPYARRFAAYVLWHTALRSANPRSKTSAVAMGQEPDALPTNLARTILTGASPRHSDPASATNVLISREDPAFPIADRARLKKAFPDHTREHMSDGPNFLRPDQASDTASVLREPPTSMAPSRRRQPMRSTAAILPD